MLRGLRGGRDSRSEEGARESGDGIRTSGEGYSEVGVELEAGWNRYSASVSPV